MLHDVAEHLRHLMLLACQVVGDALLAFAKHERHIDRLLLTEPIASPDALVILLKRMAGKHNHVVASLEVQAPRSDFRLTDKLSNLAV